MLLHTAPALIPVPVSVDTSFSQHPLSSDESLTDDEQNTTGSTVIQLSTSQNSDISDKEAMRLKDYKRASLSHDITSVRQSTPTRSPIRIPSTRKY